MSESTYLTRKEAAALCDCHVDSIRRAEKKGLLPNSRQRADGTIEIAVADLVAAGMLDPLAARTDVTEVAGRSRAERDLTVVRQELAVANTQISPPSPASPTPDGSCTYEPISTTPASTTSTPSSTQLPVPGPGG
ncbi:MAG: hypothetical protein S0880_25955 [Actinomycetota bacterium]|nr:hypothetical protein [Actinomycetota bacterium]